MSDSDHTVKYTGTARLWRSAAGYSVSQADPYIENLSDEEADTLVENYEFEHVEDADADRVLDDEDEDEIADALSGSVGDLEDALATGEYDDQLTALEAYEREHAERKTAFDAISDRREEIQASGENAGLSDDYRDGMESDGDEDQEE